MTRLLSAAAAAVALISSSAQAQAFTCRPSAGSNEAALLTHYGVPLAFGAALPSPKLRRGEVVVALEASYLSSPAADVQRSDECFLDKAENTGLSPVLPRPRIAVGLPAGLMIEASLLPPVTVADATPFLLGVALSYATTINTKGTLYARAHGTLGYVDGPVTCSRSALQNDPTRPCFGDTPSNDRYAPNVYGGELLLDWQLRGPWSGLLGVGAVHARPRFQVNFTNRFDLRDNTRVRYDETAASVTAGVSRTLSERTAIGLVAYAVPGQTATVRVTGQWRVR